MNSIIRNAADMTNMRFGNIVVIEAIGRNADNRVMWKCACDCGNEEIWTSRHLREKHVTACRKCLDWKMGGHGAQIVAGEVRGEHEILEVMHVEVSGTVRTYCKCKCMKCGEILNLRSDEIADKKCNKDTLPRGERMIQQMLEEAAIEYEMQKKYGECRFEDTNAYARFDFYLPAYNTIIEYDGEQHFKAVSHWGGQKAFEKNQRHDAMKTKFCIDNGIILIRIPYTHRKHMRLEDLLPTTSTFRV